MPWMKRVARTLGPLLVIAMTFTPQTTTAEQPDYSNDFDKANAETFARREADWRIGAVVYQVIVDRFAPSENLDAKRDLYAPPRQLRDWSETPTAGHYVEEAEVWSHEIDFWGGDLQSLIGKLDYLDDLGVDVLYLNPIHMAYTNHKYDAQNYFEVSPEYGTRKDVIALADGLHERGMKLVLDGVFNHMGRTSPWFQEALADPSSPWRDWYYIDPKYQYGYRAWADVENLPEVRIENPNVRARLWGDKDSVIQGYLNDGVDGWRLDVAYDLGFNYLHDLTEAAHTAKPGSLVIGEVWNYPEEWLPSVDGLMNMTGREVILRVTRGEVPGPQAGRILEQMVEDCGLESLMKSWLMLDNHDTSRMATSLPETWQQHLAQVLQFTLPGSPCVYYGTEVGLEGKSDPEQRGPMRWDRVESGDLHLEWLKKLVAIRQESRALRVGDFRLIETTDLLAFTRRTDRVRDTVVIVANPTDREVTELLVLRNSKLMSYTPMVDALTGTEHQTRSGTLYLTVAPHTAMILRPQIPDTIEYSRFKRIQ